MIDQAVFFLNRVFFVVALLLLVVALWDRLLQTFGWTLTFLPYQPSRLLEISAILMVFVIAMLLRQIRDRIQAK